MQRHERSTESGFTLVELLVVILIIAVLAALAIPAFLAQRQRGWEAQVTSSLKNAATTQDSFLTVAGSYTTSVADLQSEGLRPGSGIALSVPQANGAIDFCMEATHPGLPSAWHYDSDDGMPAAGGC